VLVNSSAHVIVPSLFSKMTYDPLRDFAPVTVVSTAPLVLVVPRSFPPKNVSELIALAKARPGELGFASSGNGSSTHLTAELFRTVTNIHLTHVPYKGQSQALTDVVSGQVPIMFNTIPAALEFVKAGRLRALGVTAERRASQLPAIPTFVEAGYRDFVTMSWYAVWLPAKTPEAIVARLGDEIRRIVAQPAVRAYITELGGDPLGNTAAEFDAFQRAEAALWARVVEKAALKRE
jgi:tripartite-type tricarboxylate transporter receptor subunit TctC